MFNPFDQEDTDLDEAIASAYAHLTTLTADTDEYEQTVDQISKLYALKTQIAELSLQAQQSYATHQLAQDQSTWQEEQDDLPFYKRIDPNTALTVLGNLTVALIVIKYEQTGVIATQVRNFMQKI
jgi:hypothetical protein